MDGWSLSKRADDDWESIDDWVASAAKEEVVSWYLYHLVSPAFNATNFRRITIYRLVQQRESHYGKQISPEGFFV